MTDQWEAQEPLRLLPEGARMPSSGPSSGAAKAFEPEDPMDLTGVILPDGDLNEQLEAFVLEYLMLGWSERQILLLFRRPAFGGTYRIAQALGENHVRERVHTMFGEWSRG